MTGKAALLDDPMPAPGAPATGHHRRAAAAPAAPVPAASTAWSRVKRYAPPVLGLVVLGLLLSHAHTIDWRGAWRAVQAYPAATLGAALGLALTSHVLYGCFDLIGRHHTRHGLPAWRTWAIAVASYAFNLNLGSLVGGVALRARLYARAGLDEVNVAQVVGLSMATNWLGYGLLAGGLFAAGVIEPPAQAHLEPQTLRLLGGAMVLLAAGYVLACALCRGRHLRIRGRRVRLPSPGLALVQLGLSASNWALMGAAIHVLLGPQVPYGTALGVLMAAAVVGVVMPIPGGLGVLEAVYIAMLADDLGQGRVMGAVMAYRALYYLVPLASGLVLYALLERYASTHPASAEPEGPAGGAGSGEAGDAAGT
jgi:uncharacterized membrane protein YbhN (UPF0104 family)